MDEPTLDNADGLSEADWDEHAQETKEFVRQKCEDLGTHQATRLFASQLSSELSMTRAHDADGVTETTRDAQDTAKRLQYLVEAELGID